MAGQPSSPSALLHLFIHRVLLPRPAVGDLPHPAPQFRRTGNASDDHPVDHAPDRHEYLSPRPRQSHDQRIQVEQRSRGGNLTLCVQGGPMSAGQDGRSGNGGVVRTGSGGGAGTAARCGRYGPHSAVSPRTCPGSCPEAAMVRARLAGTAAGVAGPAPLPPAVGAVDDRNLVLAALRAAARPACAEQPTACRDCPVLAVPRASLPRGAAAAPLEQHRSSC